MFCCRDNLVYHEYGKVFELHKKTKRNEYGHEGGNVGMFEGWKVIKDDKFICMPMDGWMTGSLQLKFSLPSIFSSFSELSIIAHKFYFIKMTNVMDLSHQVGNASNRDD